MTHTYFREQWECNHGMGRSVALIFIPMSFSFRELKVMTSCRMRVIRNIYQGYVHFCMFWIIAPG